jgi:hypothetical protein
MDPLRVILGLNPWVRGSLRLCARTDVPSFLVYAFTCTGRAIEGTATKVVTIRIKRYRMNALGFIEAKPLGGIWVMAMIVWIASESGRRLLNFQDTVFLPALNTMEQSSPNSLVFFSVP